MRSWSCSGPIDFAAVPLQGRNHRGPFVASKKSPSRRAGLAPRSPYENSILALKSQFYDTGVSVVTERAFMVGRLIADLVDLLLFMERLRVVDEDGRLADDRPMTLWFADQDDAV